MRVPSMGSWGRARTRGPTLKLVDPRVKLLWINPPATSTAQITPGGATIVTPDDPQHGGINGAHVTPEHQSTARTHIRELLQ